MKETLDRFNIQYKDSKSFEEEKEVILQYLVFFEKYIMINEELLSQSNVSPS